MSHKLEIIPSRPIIILSRFGFILLMRLGPMRPPAIAPMLKEIIRVQYICPDKIIYNENEAKQMKTSAKVVVAIEALESKPPIIPPVLVTGPNPPPERALLKAAIIPRIICFHQEKLKRKVVKHRTLIIKTIIHMQDFTTIVGKLIPRKTPNATANKPGITIASTTLLSLENPLKLAFL